MMNGILIIAIVATITQANVIEFSEDALSDLRLTSTAGTSTQAVMVHPGKKVKFILRRYRDTNEADFRAVYDSDVAKQIPYADHFEFVSDKNYPGIVLPEEGRRTISRIISFNIRVFGERSQPQTMTFRVFFKRTGLPPLVLETPVFQLPSAISRISNEGEFKAWAKENNVCVEPPFDSENLLIAQNGGKMEMDFNWLDQLLAFKVTKRSGALAPPNVQPVSGRVGMYVTRPLLLREDLLTSSLNTIETVNDSQDESGGSTWGAIL